MLLSFLFVSYTVDILICQESVFVSYLVGVLQAWITLGRAQLNFGEPDNAIQSFDKALAIKV